VTVTEKPVAEASGRSAGLAKSVQGDLVTVTARAGRATW